jgi:hypothetical protein
MIFEYIKQSLFFLRQNLKTLATINLPFIIISYLFMQQFDLSLENQTPQQLADSMLTISAFNLLIMPIYWGATIAFMQSTVSGKTYSASQALFASAKLWFKLFIVFTIYSLLISMGLLLLIVPGIYIAIRLSIADYICVIEKRSILECLNDSWKQTKEYVWPILQGVALISISVLVMRSLALNLTHSIFPDQLGVSILINICFDILNFLVLIYGFRIYCIIKAEL